ncbi:MAG: hypothetical protein CBC10_004790 [Gammaproteobacteria bacterium TMED50]|nr:MAG: hypothetical protein CBC10_004790 [Gammaproteobacteria bacterium TMED50]
MSRSHVPDRGAWGRPVAVHVLGVLLVVGRLVHAIGVSRVSEDYRLRVFGMVCTLAVLVGAVLRLLAGSLVI